MPPSAKDLKEPLVSSEFSELHHYTDWKGLEGIWTNGTIWASDYRFLNDFSEVVLLKEYLQEELRKRLADYILSRSKHDSEFKAQVRETGSVSQIANNASSGTVESLYEVTFGSTQSPPFASPYIASFCYHSPEESYEQVNGLLSQWRAYGGDKRYAIVFDTKKLEKLIEKEVGVYSYQSSSFVDVIYSHMIEERADQFNALVEYVFDAAVAMLQGEEPITERLYELFVIFACRFKHQGFREEREVRIVANPFTRDMDAHLKNVAQEEYKPPTKKFKDIKLLKNSGKEYVALFDFNEGRRLPIKRIIVGPNRYKDRNAGKVRRLIQSRVRVDVSQTPYIG